MKNNNSRKDIVPILSYSNLGISKSIIYKENRRKSSIYRLYNIITGRSYIGSSIDLSRRFSNYYSIVYMNNSLKNSSNIIYSSLLKNGYANFSLDILEYCKPDELYCKPDELYSREQYYIDILKPEYNILKVAGSMLGFKHSEATKAKMKNSKLGKKHTYETRQKIGLSLKFSVKVNTKPKLITRDILK